ncbi:MAG: sigma-70 family RNA polymerase sigma factor, partial [Nitrospira sp.]|nr:sigma-70 family RNA polymerase sigma factor [Nitrospira sp.]
MSRTEEQSDAAAAGPREFCTTHWSLVLLARRDDTVHAEPALAELCRMYWYPLYAYVRRLGRSAEDAQDLTQEFFSRLIEKRWLDRADRDRGKFRTFLLTVFKRFM